MKRQLEPELMVEETQVKAYAEADFSQPHNHFITLFKEIFAAQQGYALDLGCGSGDISLRFAKAYPDCHIHGIDASATMLNYAERSLKQSKLTNLNFFKAYLPTETLPRHNYDIIISNSLLHHLPEPQVLWQTVKRYRKQDTKIFIMDLMRPQTIAQAQSLVKTYANDEPEVLQHDFYHSLLAAFEIDEIKAQLQQAQLKLDCKIVSNRHFIVYG